MSETIRVSHNYRRPLSRFTCAEVPDLCTAHEDIRRAYMAIGHQLRALLGGEWQPREMFPDDKPWPVGDQLVWERRV